MASALPPGFCPAFGATNRSPSATIAKVIQLSALLLGARLSAKAARLMIRRKHDREFFVHEYAASLPLAEKLKSGKI
jgi:hypothetical protein